MTTQNPGKASIVLGISDSITSGAALVVDGRVVAAVNEERLNRVKMAMGWPRLSIAEVLRIAGVEPKDIDLVAVATRTLYWRPEVDTIQGYFDASWGSDRKFMLRLGSLGASVFGHVRAAQKPYYALKSLLALKRRFAIPRELRRMAISAPIRYVDHHLSHAAAVYYTGGHEEATIVTLDGAGDALSATVYDASRGELRRMRAVPAYDSIGNFYSYVTHILGFKAHRHEGKITGLAAYGKPVYADLFRGLVGYRNGTIRNRARAFHTSAIRKIRRLLPSDADRADVAASIQQVLEEVCAAFAGHWVGRLGHRHLGLAGGVPANVKLNQRLFALDSVDSVFVYPAMGDDGLAAGAALQVYAGGLLPERRAEVVHRLSHVFLGASYADSRLEACLDASGLRYEKPRRLAAEVARLVADRKVVARFDGRMEYGPRALGNRSILVHAGDPTVNDWLNKKLGRTEFMPFAPVTLEEDYDSCYVGLKGAEHTARFMTITCDCTPELVESCPAIVHVDGTARPQLIGHENPGYRAILEEYKKRTGLSTMINTSFNMHEEPIVCTPEDALRAFQLGHLDYMAFGGHLVAGSDSPLPSQAARASANDA